MRHGSWVVVIILVMMFFPIVGMAEQPQSPAVGQAKEDPVQIAYNEAAKDLGARLFHLTATVKLLENQLKATVEENQRLKEAAKKEKPSSIVEDASGSKVMEKK